LGGARFGPFTHQGPAIASGTPRSFPKRLMIVDPSGNLIEIKAYRQPEHVLGPLAG
jgi:extradiol dioxygenase family protein